MFTTSRICRYQASWPWRNVGLGRSSPPWWDNTAAQKQTGSAWGRRWWWSLQTHTTNSRKNHLLGENTGLFQDCCSMGTLGKHRTSMIRVQPTRFILYYIKITDSDSFTWMDFISSTTKTLANIQDLIQWEVGCGLTPLCYIMNSQ